MDREPAYRAVYRAIGEHPPRSFGDYEAAAENARIWRAVKAALDTIEGDPCADIPDAPEPGRYVPALGARVRTGRKVPLHLYLHTADNPVGQPIGVIYHSPELARFVVEAVNAELRLREYGTIMGSTDPGGAPYPELYAIMRDAEAMLAGRNAGHPERIHQELRRMRGELDRAVRAVENMAEHEQGDANG